MGGIATTPARTARRASAGERRFENRTSVRYTPAAMPSGQAAIEESTSPAVREKVPASSWYVLLVLTLVYVLNFLDRSLIYILFTPIKAEMAFSDLQLALLGTTSFVIFY